jgi:eukaryotic-like serine/threonine-protein kinase
MVNGGKWWVVNGVSSFGFYQDNAEKITDNNCSNCSTIASIACPGIRAVDQPNNRVKAIFDEALAIGSSPERVAYLDKACAGAPELRKEVEALLDARAGAGHSLPAVVPGGETTGFTPAGPGVDGSRLPEEEKPALPREPLVEGVGTRIGPYKLVQQLGEGGMGAVYVADQTTPVKRRVALKVIKPGMDSVQILHRFEAERQALALMDHSNIAKVLDAGTTAAGRPYFVMELVKGVPITTYCDELHLSLRERLELFLPVCQAIQHAHQKGIIHRDIKPSNVLVSMQDGQPVPKVIDFGVAKALHQRLTDQSMYTEIGQIVGTLEYMSPEQAELSALDIDTRADIYALGVLLYELLTGTTPLDRKRLRQAGYSEIVRLIREVEPPKPSTRLSQSKDSLTNLSLQRRTDPARLMKEVRGELDWIVMKCLEKDRTRRYETANSLAHDVARFLKDEPVEACPPSRRYRLSKFVRKHRAGLVVAMLFVTLLLAGVAVSSWLAVRATVAEGKTRAALKEARRRTAVQMLERGLGLCEQRQEARGMLWLARSLQEVPDADDPLNETIRANLSNWATCVHQLRGVLPHQGEVRSVAFSRDGRLALSASDDKTAQLWSVATGQPVGPALQHAAPVLMAVFSPDGQTVLTGSADKTARLWSTATGQPLGPPLQHQGAVGAVAFDPSGQLVLTGSEDKTAQLWSVATGQPQGPPLKHQGPVRSVAFSPDGRIILTASDDRTAQLWSVTTGESVAPPLKHEGAVGCAVFSPDGETVLTGSERNARLWSVATGLPLVPPLPRQGTVLSVAFSPDGRTVLTGSKDKSARLWSVATGLPLGPPLLHQTWVGAVAFSSDGNSVLTGSEDNMARLWSVATGQPLGPPLQHEKQVRSVAFSPDGRMVLTGSNDHTARLWSVATGPALEQTLPHRDWVVAAAFSPDGGTVVTGSDDKTARLWSVATGQQLGPPLQHQDGVWSVAFSPDGKAVLTGSKDGTAQLWSVATGQRLLPVLRHQGPVWSAVFSPDGKTLLTESDEQQTRRWSAATGELLGTPTPHQHDLYALAYSADGRTLLSAADKTVKQWSTATGELVGPSFPHSARVRRVAYSSDGRMVLTGCDDYTARLWSATTGEPLGPPLHHQAAVLAVAFSPDARTVLTGSGDKTARLWSVATGEPLGPPLLQGPVWAVTFSPDGRKILTGSEDHTARLWSVRPPLEADVGVINLWLEVVTGMALDEHHAVQPLEASDWRSRRQKLLELGRQDLLE